jgi:hypothetical protein
MVAKAAKVQASALEAAVLLTASAQNLEDPLTHAMRGVTGAIAVLIMDMTMVAMIVARMTMTTSAATLRVTGLQLRRGGAGGGTTREVVKRLDMRSRVRVYYYFAPLVRFSLMFVSLRYVCVFGTNVRIRLYDLHDVDDLRLDLVPDTDSSWR